MKHLFPKTFLVLFAMAMSFPAQSQSTSSVRADGTILVNGEPYFPFGYYHVSWIGNRKGQQLIDDLNVVADQEANFIHPNLDPVPASDEFLQVAAQRGVYVGVEMFWPDREAIINQMKDEPAILGWTIGDDVNFPSETPRYSPQELRSRHEEIKALDPNHITYASAIGAPSLEIEAYVQAQSADVLGTQSYPIDNEVEFEDELEQHIRYYEHIYESVQGYDNIAVTANLQAFAWDGRYPDLEETRNMLYGALIYGVKGIMAYRYYDGGLPLSEAQPVLWDEWGVLEKEVSQLAPALMDGTHSLINTGVDNIYAARWDYQGEAYLALINTSRDASRSVSISLGEEFSGLAALFGNRPQGLSLSEGTLSGTIQPLDAHVYKVTTDPIEPPTSEYCASSGNSTEDEWVDTVVLGDFTQSSGDNSGYGDFTDQTIEVAQRESYALTLTPGYTGEERSEYWKIYADLNQDGDFDEANELLYDAGTAQTGTTTGSLTIPADAFLGETRLRIIMKFTDSDDSDIPEACSSFGFGEVEDYVLNVIEGSGELPIPEGYCVNRGGSTQDEWIDEIVIGDFTNASGDDNGYGDFISQTIELEQGESYDLTLTPGYTETEYSEYWKIYADLDRDSVFDETTELLFDAGSEQIGTVSGSLTIPNDAPPGETRLRVIMKYTDDDDSDAPDACTAFGFGETEEYTLMVVESTSGGGDTEGSGLTAEYFNNKNLSGSPLLTQVDTTVDFNWNRTAPDAALPTDKFSVRWTGQVQPAYSETYTFITRSDDGVRLWVNGEQLINNWTNHAVQTDRGKITLQAGEKYDIRLEYFENTGKAVCRLLWRSPSQDRQVIPRERLYPTTLDVTTDAQRYTVRARGKQGGEAMALQIDGVTLAEWTLNTTMQDYCYTGVETGTVRVVFLNDQGVNHDLIVDKLTIDDAVYQAEDQAINTAVWQNGSCGGAYSEWLHCLGYIEFEITATSARVASSGKSIREASLGTEELFTDVRVYPNPASQAGFTVEGVTGDSQLWLYDTQGRAVSFTTEVAGERQRVLRPQRTLAPGMYLLKMRTPVAQYQQKVLIK